MTMRRPVILLYVAALGAACGATAWVELGSDSWIGELLSNLRLHLALSCLVLGVLALVLPLRWRWRLDLLLASAALAALHAAPLSPYVAQSPPQALQPPAQGTLLRVLVANLHSWAVDVAALERLVRQGGADIVLLTEITPVQQPAYDRLRDLYPHQFQTPPGQDNTFTLRLLARRPMEVALLAPLSGDYPIVQARLCGLASGCVMVITAHPPRPGPQRWRRNKLLAALAGYAQRAVQNGDRVIAAGDFNVTAFSADFAVFAQAGLIDTALGRGYPSTWPLWLGPKSPAGLPGLGVGIDQVLVSPGIGVVQRWLGPDIGSDHWPLFVELKIP